MIKPVVERIVEAHCADEDIPEEWNLDAIVDYAHATFLKEGTIKREDLEGREKASIVGFLMEEVRKLYDEREKQIGEETMREFEKVVVLRAVDSKWMDHIDAMDQLRQGIHLRAYGGTDPLREYQFEGFEMFREMVENIQEEVTKYIMKAHVESNVQRQEVAKGQTEAGGGSSSREAQRRPIRREGQRVGRNDPCPCGSGKKYKHCHGANV